MPNNPPKLMRTPSKYLGAALTLCLCTLLSEQAISQPTSSPSASTSPSSSRVKHRPKGLLVPYHGIISAVDKDAKTFTIEGRRESRVLKMIDGTLHNERRGNRDHRRYQQGRRGKRLLSQGLRRNASGQDGQNRAGEAKGNAYTDGIASRLVCFR